MGKVKHLLDLPESGTHLSLWRADLKEEGSFDDAIQGCIGVFHVASPMNIRSQDPQVFFIDKEEINSCVINKNNFVFLVTERTVNVVAERSDKPNSERGLRYHESLHQGQDRQARHLHFNHRNHYIWAETNLVSV